ncbi:shikimate kinase [Betaproteobacteria bacterium]|nr:shikimate kinase [Betaproteobacteria bacterium]
MDNFLENIYLVGLMGAGKTTIGRSLAKRLDSHFVDTDKEIESRTGVSIPTIFEIEGEDGFRKRESQVIAEISRKNGFVVATGGGGVLREENRENMRASGFVIYLNVSPQMLWERTRHDKNRPLLQVTDPLLKLNQLFTARDPLYREVANLVVEGGRMSAQGVLQYLLKELSARWNPP